MATQENTSPEAICFGLYSSVILTYEQSVIITSIGFVALSCATSLFGILANGINLIIFYRQGLDTTMNISFFALAISDLLSLVTLEASSILLNPLLSNSDISMCTPEVQYLISSWPHVCFGHITCWITAYITAERCLCIAFPLKIKQIVTPRRAAWCLFCMYLINIIAACPEFSSVYIDWKFYPEINKSLLGLVYKENRQETKQIGFFLLGVLGAVSFPAVIVFTVILIVKLKQQSKWRKNSTKDNSHSEAITKRDIKTMNMVVLIAIILIVCYTPGVMASMATSFVPEFEIAGTEVNLFRGLWGFGFVFEAVNSSVNIFLYYKMSTKFRHSFQDLFQRCRIKSSDHLDRADTSNDDDD